MAVTITMYNDINVDDAFSPLFVAVNTLGTNGVGTTTDPNATWADATIPGGAAAWNSVCYGNKSVVAVCGGPSVSAASSYNGSTWNLRPLPTSKVWQSVAYGGGTFVAISNGTVDSAISTDGIVWTSGGNLPAVQSWYCVTYGGGKFVAVSNTNAPSGAYSTNGISWEPSAMPSSKNWRSVCYGGGKFVAVSYGTTDVAVSTDGIAWNIYHMPTVRNWSSVAYGNGIYVAVAYGTNVAAISTDGQTWVEQQMSATANWIAICFGITSVQGLGIFTVSAYGGAVTSVSYDGVVWVSKAQRSANFTMNCFAPVTWNSGDTLSIQNNAKITVNTDQKKFWKAVTATYGQLNISNDNVAVSGGKHFMMGRITAATANSITVGSGLFSINVSGSWISLGTGNASAGQSFTAPFTDYIPSIEVETSSAGVYEQWLNVTGSTGPYMHLFGKDGLEYCGNGNRGNYFVQTPVANPIEVKYLTGCTSTINSYFLTVSDTTGIIAGAAVSGSTAAIAAQTVVNQVINSTTLELNIPTTATVAGTLNCSFWNPFRAQFTSTIVVGDGINGNIIPVGRNVRCANIMVSDSSPSNTASTGFQTDAVIDMGLAAPIDARICLFDDVYMLLSQASNVYFRNVGFSHQFYINECYSIDMDYVGVAASPTYWYYSAKWIIRDQRYNTLVPIGYTAPGSGVHALFSYMHNAKMKNFHKVIYAPAFLTGTSPVHLLNLTFTNDSTWENIRISCLNNTRVVYGFYMSDSCYRNTITNLQMYGITPLALGLSSDNVFNGIEYSLSMNSVIQGFKSLYRASDDPATSLPVVDNTKYYFKIRSFRSWMDRSLYFDSNEYSATPFQGSWLFPDYMSVRPTETYAKSVTLDWQQRLPCPAALVSYEVYRSTTENFTARSSAERVFAVLTPATVTCAQGTKVGSISSATRWMIFSSAGKTITAVGTPGSFYTDGFTVGDTVYIYGSYAGNNGTYTITELMPTVMTVAEALIDEVAHNAPFVNIVKVRCKSYGKRIFTIAAARTITSSGTSAGSFTVGDGFQVGDVVDISGSRTFNNGTFTINTLTATVMTMNEPMVAEVTPNSTSSATRIFVIDTTSKTISAGGAAAGSFITDGHFVGDTIYIDGSLLGNTGPYTIATLTATLMTLNETPASNETGDADPILIIHRRIYITLRAPIENTRYYYRLRKYNFNSNATLSCFSTGFYLTTNRAVTGTNTATLTTAIAHGFIAGQRITVTGLNDSTYRGTYTIATVPSTTTFTYALSHANESVADVTGRVAPADNMTATRSCSGNIATLTTTYPHRLIQDQSVVISSVEDTAYNGTYKITSVPTTGSFTYALTHDEEATTPSSAGKIENISMFSANAITNRTITTAPISISNGSGKTMTFTASTKKIVLGSGSWLTDGFLLWDTVTFSGSLAGNDGSFTISALTATDMTVLETIYDELGDGSPVITATGSNYATLTTQIAHGYVFGQDITVFGVNDPRYNGNFNVRSIPNSTSITYSVSGSTEATAIDNWGKITTSQWDFDNIYYLAGFQFPSGSTYVTNLVNNLYNSMFAPGVSVTGQGISAGTTVVSVSPNGREMIISNPTTMSTDTIFSASAATARRRIDSNVATIVTALPHNLMVGSKIKLSGMTDPTYNGTFIITFVPSPTRLRFALTHADEVETSDTAGVITVVDIVLTVPAQTGMGVYGLVGTTTGIQTGTQLVSKENSYMITLSKKPDVATAYTVISFQTFSESAEFTALPNYYVNAMNFCLRNRTFNTTWVTSGGTYGGDVYLSPTTNDWATATMDTLTATSPSACFIMNVTGLVPSTEYTASIWVRADQTYAIPDGVTGKITFGTVDTYFTATNEIKRYSATATTGVGATSLNFFVMVFTTGRVLHVGDAMVNKGATAQAAITTSTSAAELLPAATANVQLRVYCRSAEFCGSVGNQGIEMNLGTAPTDTFFSEIYMSPSAGFTPSNSTIIGRTYDVSTSNFSFLSNSNRNTLSNITKLQGGGTSCATTLGVLYFTTTATYNIVKDCNIDIEYCNADGTYPVVYLLTAAHNNFIHNMNFGRTKSYQTNGMITTRSTNSTSTNVLQNIRTKHYDIPVVLNMKDTIARGVAGGRAVPLAAATTYTIGGSTLDGFTSSYTAVYGSQFVESYTGDTEGLIALILEDTKSDTKPYTIKAGIPTFSNTGRLEMINASSVATVNRKRTGNVATIETILPHHLLLGDEFTISSLGASAYNGTQTVTSVIDTKHFTYANTGVEELETVDTSGVVTVGDSIEFICPFKVKGVSAFRKLYPKLLGVDMGTNADFLEGLKVEYSIKTGDTYGAYKRATPTNLSSETVVPSAGFNF